MVSKVVNRCRAVGHMCQTDSVSRHSATPTRVPCSGMVDFDRERDSCMHPSYDCVRVALDMQSKWSVD